LYSDHKQTYKLCLEHSFLYILKITNIAMIQNFEVIFDKLNLIRTCTGGNYIQKLITELYNY